MQIIDKNLFMLELEWFWALKEAEGCINERIISLADGRRTKEMAINFLTNTFKDFSLDVTEEDQIRFGKLFFNPENINYYSIKEFIIREINFILFCSVTENNCFDGILFTDNDKLNEEILFTYNRIYFLLFIAYIKLERMERTGEDLSREINSAVVHVFNGIGSLKINDNYIINDAMFFSLCGLLDDTREILKYNDTHMFLDNSIKKMFKQIKDTILKERENNAAEK